MNVFRSMRLPDVFTLLNVVFGFLAILAASGAYDSGFAKYALVFILLAAVSDGLDGLLARKVGGSALGPNLDSLADLVSFGIEQDWPVSRFAALHRPDDLRFVVAYVDPLIVPLMPDPSIPRFFVCGSVRIPKSDLPGHFPIGKFWSNDIGRR